MSRLIKIILRPEKKSFIVKAGFPSNQKIKRGDLVIVKTDMGLEVGLVKSSDYQVKNNKEINSEISVIRLATNRDQDKIYELNIKKTDLLDLFKKKIEFYNLPMKPIDAYITFDNKQIIFYFVSETRVDFRELAKDLIKNLRKKVILRQLGPRDTAKMIGGYGICGQPLCCFNFLENLGNVIMDMARDQDLEFRGSEKLSGVCGRLKCCLAYEEEIYNKLRKNMPELGQKVAVGREHGIIINRNILKQEVEVEFKNQNKKIVSIKDIKLVK